MNGKLVHAAPPLTIMLHKPAGFVSTRKDLHARDTVFDLLPENATPSVKFFWNLERLTTSLVTIASRETDTVELGFKDQRP